MKKKIFALIGALIILVLLFGIYLLASNKADNTEETASDDISIEDLGTQLTKADKVKSFTLNNKNGSFEFSKSGDTWKVKGYDNSFNSSAISSISSIFTSLYAEQIIEENAEDMSKYNLDSPLATATSDGVKINLGTITTDNKYYYISLNDEKTVYMVNSARVSPMEYSLNDIIDKTTYKLDTDSIQEISITYKDKEDILIKYDSESPLAREYSEKNGLATLVMEKPVSNMLVYPYNLQATILQNSDSLNIGNLVEIAPTDLSKYGLSEPNCSIYISDNTGDISINVGDFVPDTDNAYAYVLVNNRPEVFTMEYRALKPFVNASIADFVQKFISLYQRSSVSKIDITSGDKAYTVDFKAEGENDYRDIDGVKKDYRNTYINNKLVDKDTFTAFYELLIGIGFDNIVTDANISGTPAVTITFELTDGSKDIAEYYDYDNSFYIVNKGDNASMLVSKQTVRKVISEVENLAK